MSGCLDVSCMVVMFLVGGIIALFVLFVLPGVLGGWFSQALDQPIGAGLAGVALILAAGLGMVRVVAIRSRTGVTRRQILGFGVVAIVVALIGVLVLLGAIAHHPSAPAF